MKNFKSRNCISNLLSFIFLICTLVSHARVQIPDRFFNNQSKKIFELTLNESENIFPNSPFSIPPPQGPYTLMAEDPFKQLSAFSKEHRYHNLIEEIQTMLGFVKSLREYNLTPELANYWDLRIKKEFLNSNGILKILPNNSQFQINIDYSKGLQAAIWINHLLIVQKKLEAAISYQKNNKKFRFDGSEKDEVTIVSPHDLLSYQKEKYLLESDRISALILDWSHNFNNKYSEEEIDAIISSHISFGETLELSKQPIEKQISQFIEEQVAKKIARPKFSDHEKLFLWHHFQNTLRAGPTKANIAQVKNLIDLTLSYLNSHICKQADKISQKLIFTQRVLSQSENLFLENNQFFGQEMLNNCFEMLRSTIPFALQLSTHSTEFKLAN
jgi:hypothetical protein